MKIFVRKKIRTLPKPPLSNSIIPRNNTEQSITLQKTNEYERMPYSSANREILIGLLFIAEKPLKAGEWFNERFLNGLCFQFMQRLVWIGEISDSFICSLLSKNLRPTWTQNCVQNY